MQTLPSIYFQIRNKTRLPVLAKIALIYIASMYRTPLYKMVKSVTVSDEIGKERELSANAFVKRAYKLASRLGIVI